MRYLDVTLCCIPLIMTFQHLDAQENGTARGVHNHSFSRPEEAVVKHMELDLLVSFAKKQIVGRAVLYIVNSAKTDKLHLDTRGMTIKRVTIGQKKTPATFALGDADPLLGQALVVDILPETKLVTIDYETGPDAAALQWLTPSQTAGGRKPFLFTQSQAILARTWVPCQDNPGVRFTYRAKVRVPAGMMAVMSAQNPTQVNPKGQYEFYMPQPIPSYLLALAVGELDFKPISDRCGVYAEPPLVEKAAWEFADAEKMIKTAEELYGPYRWGRYDIIVLPPSFPFGGMENPRLTFATPTVLAGDRSLVAVVAHELAHSWSGNLVTNATWSDFWLNEGFTVYFERRILEALYGREYSEMLAVLGYQDLVKQIAEFGKDSPDTKLYLNLDGRDPDEAVNDIPYEKGYFFLRLLEETVGRETWDALLKKYFEKFAFQTMTTPRFVEYLREQLLQSDEALEGTLQVASWMDSTGLPSNCPVVRSTALDNVDLQLKAWSGGTPAASLATKAWTTQQWIHFIRNLPATLTKENAAELDAAFNFTSRGNAEILTEWFAKALETKYEQAYPAIQRFLTSMGRRKLLKPLYTQMAKSREGREMARRIYALARPGYHSVSVRTVDEILK
jgi:leukotriene-A4 hydrolase